MKVFLSWSGDLSLKIACAFRDWMPSVIQSVQPYVSSEDIDKGARWSTDIAQELEESSFGIICVTRDNVTAPWVNFEAGALSKTFDKSKVCPFLYNIKRAELQGPLLQFQSAVFQKTDVEKLIFSINNALLKEEALDNILLKKSFEVWWPHLKQQLDDLGKGQIAKGETDDVEVHKTGESSVILEELLELSRNQQRLLRSPTDLIPPDYLSSIIKSSLGPRMGGLDSDLAEAINFLYDRYTELNSLIDSIRGEPEKTLDEVSLNEIVNITGKLGGVVNYLQREYGGLRPIRPSRRTKT